MRSRSVLIGLVVFGAGVLAALVVLSRLVVSQAPVLPVLWFLSMLSGVGFAITAASAVMPHAPCAAARPSR